MTSKYQAAMNALARGESHVMTVHGNSMLPIIRSGSTLTFQAFPEYEVDDIVFCRVRGRFIDAHKVTAKAIDGDRVRYQISNNHGLINGWTVAVFGRVTMIVDPSGGSRIVGPGKGARRVA